MSKETNGIKGPKIDFPAVQEMNCPCCDAVTGHEVKNGSWTCVICQTPLK